MSTSVESSGKRCGPDAADGVNGRRPGSPGAGGESGDSTRMAFVARQPIFDRALAVRGYELLYRSAGTTVARFESAAAATAEVIVSAVIDVGMRCLTGVRPAFINFPREMLVSPLPLPLEPRRVVIEVLEDVQADAQLLAALDLLRRRGHRIALDDFDPREGSEALLARADIVKLDVRTHSSARLAELVRMLRRQRLELIAEKIETPEELERCQALGFDGFQGYFLERPETFSAHRAPSSRAATLRLLLQLHDPTVSAADMEVAIACDGGLCYRILRCVNSSYYRWPRAIESIRQAVVVLGFSELRAICAAILLTRFEDRPPYLAAQALIRARMCEALCISGGREERERYFMAGMLSLMDALLGLPLADALRTLPLSAPMLGALLRREGALGEALVCVQHFERGEWADIRFRGLPQSAIWEAYRDAVCWADDLWRALSGSA